MYKEGEMTEYGWYDQDLENEIKIIQILWHCDREEAIIKVFDIIPDRNTIQN
jgi:hypothetical protein